MRRYWWVNHKQTSKHEISGQFLWSPKHNQNGYYNQFYHNMRLASPGDYVLSFADAQIKYIGTVIDFAMTTPKPSVFGKAGADWADEGWLLPVSWSKLPVPISPIDFIEELRPLLPDKYSPLKASGKGNEVYLTEPGFEVFKLVMTKAGIDLDLAMAEPELASIFGECAEQLDEAVERQLEISGLSSTEISQIVKARRGQGLFRSNVRKIEKCCRLTGIDNPSFLVASHIKPWRDCKDAAERLDGNNGLMLTPHVDLLFDRGLISFQDEGHLMVSAAMTAADLKRLGLEAGKITPIKFSTSQISYLQHHRSKVFISLESKHRT